MSRNLADLHPVLKAMAEQFLGRCREAGIDVLIYETFREQGRQNELWKQGRTKPGNIVTWTRKSKHSHEENGKPASLAFDAVPLKSGKPDWMANRTYQVMDEIGAKIGLEKVRGDSPHYQIDL